VLKYLFPVVVGVAMLMEPILASRAQNGDTHAVKSPKMSVHMWSNYPIEGTPRC